MCLLSVWHTWATSGSATWRARVRVERKRVRNAARKKRIVTAVCRCARARLEVAERLLRAEGRSGKASANVEVQVGSGHVLVL